MAAIGRDLRAAGYAVHAPNYPARRHDLAALAAIIRPGVTAFARGIDGPLDFVTHSLGGLLARAFIAAGKPDRLGAVVMLGPPHQGSPLGDLLFRLKLAGIMLGPVGAQLCTKRDAADAALLGVIDYPLGIIAGNRPLDPLFPRLLIAGANDGKVSVESTRVAGMNDHITLPVSHTMMVYNPHVRREILNFLSGGRFAATGRVDQALQSSPR
jgi:hypothetical protein